MSHKKHTGFVPYKLQYGKDPTVKIKEIINFPVMKEIPLIRKVQIALANLKHNAEKPKKSQKSISKIEFKLDEHVLLRVPHISNAIDKTIKKFFHL